MMANSSAFSLSNNIVKALPAMVVTYQTLTESLIMRKRLLLLTLSALFLCARVDIVSAASGTIQFTGAISEPACSTDVSVRRTVVYCTRKAIMRQLNYGTRSVTQAAPYDLATVSQITGKQRRDITLTYR